METKQGFAGHGLSVPEPGIIMKLRSFLGMIKKELIVLKRYPVSMAASFLQLIFVSIVIITALLLFTPSNGGGASTIVLAGLMAWGLIIYLFFESSVWQIGNSIRQEQYQGTIESLVLSPSGMGFRSMISRTAFVLVLTTIHSIAIALAISILIGRFIPTYNFLFAVVVLVFTLSGFLGVNFGLSAIALWLKESHNILLSVVIFASMLLCAFFFPFYVLPEPVLFISRLIPIAWGVDLFRSALIGFPTIIVGGRSIIFPELMPLPLEILGVFLFDHRVISASQKERPGVFIHRLVIGHCLIVK